MRLTCSFGLTWHHHPAPVDVETWSHSRKADKEEHGWWEINGRIKRERRKEIQAEKKKGVCGGDTDPVMTAAWSTTTRGSGFFCVSLESGKKVGQNYRVKVKTLNHRGEKGQGNAQQLLCKAQTMQNNVYHRVYNRMHIINICNLCYPFGVRQQD